MEYKNYLGYAFFDRQAHLFHGEVLGIKNVITFQSTIITELEKAFHDSVSEKAFSGSLYVRISSDLHAKLARKAMKFSR